MLDYSHNCVRKLLNTARFLGLACLLLMTAQVAFAQTDPTVSIHDNGMFEGDTATVLFGTFFEVTLSAPSTKTISVQVTTQPGTATGGADFGEGIATVTFDPGQTSRQVQVFAVGDTLVEGTEQFFLNLANPSNATIGDGQAVASIIDDDALILLNQTSSPRAAAVDSVYFNTETLPVTNLVNFSPDNRTRVIVFAIGLKWTTGDPLSSVTATAEDSQGTIQPVTVEFVSKFPNHFWLTQVVVKLNSQPTSGDLKIRVTWHGQTSNAVLVAVKP